MKPMKRQNRVAFLNIASTLLKDGIALITAPLFAALLGKDGYGVTSIYNIWVSVIAIAFALQTQGTLVNARVEYPEDQQEKYQSSVMSLSLLAYAVCTALVLIFMGPISELLKLNKLLIIMMLLHGFGTYCINFVSTKFIYEFKAGWKMIISLSVTILTLVLSLAFILPMPQESRYMGRTLAICATYVLIGFPACIYVLVRGKTFYNREYWKFCLYLAVPIVFYNLSDLILGQSDALMIQHMLSEGAVGQYSLGLKYGGIMYTIFATLNHTWCPFFFDDLKRGDRAALEERSKNFLEVFTVLSVGFILLINEVFHFLSKEEFWPATGLIPVFVTSYFLNFLSTFPVNYEYYRKNTRAVAVVTVVTSLVNLGLNYVLIRRLGMAGAALATAISHGLQLTLHHCFARYVLGKEDYPFRIRFWRPYVLCYAAVLVLVYLTPGAWYIRWPLGAAIGLWELWRIKKRKVLI